MLEPARPKWLLQKKAVDCIDKYQIDTVGLDAKRTLTRSGSERRTRPLGRFLRPAFQQHRIAITKEAITFCNGMPVQRMHLLKAGKRRHQHQQAAFG